MKKLENKSFEIKSIDFNQETKEMIISGYAATFNNTDTKQMTWNRDIGDYVMCSDTIVKGAFAKTIQENKKRIAFCQNHEIDEPKAKILELKEDDYGLWFSARISDAEPELKTKIKETIFEEFSIGFQTINSAWEQQSDGTYLRKLTEIKLWEISIVTIARDENSRITDIKSLQLANGVIEKLIKNEKNEEKKFQLLQLKSLIDGEPEQPLENQKKPIEEKKGLNLSKYKFINS